MKQPISINEIAIRNDIRPGDLGFVIHRHGKMYGEEYQYGVAFETYVAAGMYEFYKNYDPAADRVWICEHRGVIVGFLLLMHRDNKTAQLRFFYLESNCRGIGLGSKLMKEFLQHLHNQNYHSCYLWTTNEQTDAAALYQKFGFELTDEKESGSFGKKVTEQKYELKVQRQV